MKYFFLLLLLLATALLPAEATNQGKPKAGFFTSPDSVEVMESATTISSSFAERVATKDFYLLAIPPTGNITFDITALGIRDALTEERKDVFRDFDEAARTEFLGDVRAKITLKEFGVFRNVRAAKLVVDRTRAIYRQQKNWEVCSYTIRVNYPPFTKTSSTISDSALREGMYRRLLDSIVVAPRAIDSFADDTAAKLFPVPERDPLVAGRGWWRIPIAKDGVYLLDGKFFSDSKMDAANLTASDIRIVRKGLPVQTSAFGDPTIPFSQGGRVIFYARGNESPETAEASYFIMPPGTAGEPSWMPTAVPGDDPPPLRKTYSRTYLNEKDELFETRMGSFLSVQKMLWVWAEIKHGEGTTIEFDVPGFSQADSGETTTATLHLYSRADSVAPAATFSLLVNDEKISNVKVTTVTTPLQILIPSKLLRDTANKLTISTDIAAESKQPPIFADSLDVQYTSLFAGRNGSLKVNFPGDEIASRARLQLTGFRAQHLVALKVGDNSVERVNALGGRGFALVDTEIGPESHYLFVEEEQIPRPPLAEPVSGDSLSPDGDADVLVIYHQRFHEAADDLVKNLQESAIHASGVDVQNIYNAYNHGDLSTVAIRDYLSGAVHTWKGRRPYAAILIGDANADGHNISRQNIPNLLPIHSISGNSPGQANRISSDSYYSWLNAGDEAADLIVSRIPASEPQDAMNAVKNIIAYRADQETPADWKHRIMFMADTGGFLDSVNNLSETYSQTIGDQTILSVDNLPWEDNYYLPPGMIAREEDSKVSPAMTAAISDVYTQGCAVSLFFGHGAPNLWSNQRFWFGGGTPNSDILRMEVTHRLPFVTSFTCNNAVIDYPLRPWNVCIAEDFMRYEGKGAIGCFMPSGPGYVTNHEVLADGFLRGWTIGVREHGILSELSRINHQVRMEQDDHSRMYIELGDPTLKLSEPPQAKPPEETRSPLFVQRIVPIDEPTSASLAGKWAVSLMNRSHERRGGPLTISMMDARGATVQSQRNDAVVEALAEKNVVLEANLPSAGYYRIQAEFLSGEDPKSSSESLSRVAAYEFAVPRSGGGLDIEESTIAIREAAAAGGKARLEYAVSNAGIAPAQGQVNIRGVSEGTEVFAFQRRTELIQPGKVVSITESLPISTLLENALTIEFEWVQPDVATPALLGGKKSITINPAQTADLQIVPGSLEVDPQEPFEGGTVFVTGEVSNAGPIPSAPAAIGLYTEEDSVLAKPLRNLASASPALMASLKPGEKRHFKLRWDPKDNAGDQKIVAVIDTGFLNVESQRGNNRAPVSFHVKTKTKLASGRMIISNTANPKHVQLIAQVSNLGEVDSRPVAVTFYNSQTQSDSTKLGEVIVPSIAAGQTMEVPIEVSLESFSIDPTKFQPSFTIALKGSLMRVSSVAK